MTVWSNTLQKRHHKKKVDSLGYLKFAVANSFRLKKLRHKKERKQKQKDVQRKRLEDRAEKFSKSTPVFQCTKYNSQTKERTLEADKENLPPKSEKVNVRRNILLNINNFSYNPTHQTPRSDLFSNKIENNNNSATELLLSNGNNSVTKYNLIDPATRHKMKLMEINSQIKSNLDHLEKLCLLKKRLQSKKF